MFNRKNQKPTLTSILLLLISTMQMVSAQEGWSFPVLADWHAAEALIYPGKRQDLIKDKTDQIKKVYLDAGGDFILLPGDTQGGHWDNQSFISEYAPGATPAEAITKAGTYCYEGIEEIFSAAGYSRLIYALGDHEVGDNNWHVNDSKSKNLHIYKKVFADIINKDEEDNFLFKEKINGVESRPLGTPFENTSFAFVHKNSLIVTIDIFHQENPAKKISRYGTVVGEVTGKHLEWFDRVLAAAQKDPQIKHIFVQSHLPVLLPVRKLNSSGMFVNNTRDSEFWKTMRKHSVDVYFAGEVHENTVTRDPHPGSDLLQVVSKGNGARGFVNVKVNNNKIELIYRQNNKHRKTGSNEPYYYTRGQLTIDKSGPEKSIISSGVLEMIDTQDVFVNYTFEPGDIVTIEQSPFEWMPYDKYPISRKAVFMKNQGIWGFSMSAFTVNPQFAEGVFGKSLVLDETKHFYSYGMGPSSGDDPRSVALWIKTGSKDKMIIFSTSPRFGNGKSLFDLQLNDGKLSFMNADGHELKTKHTRLNDSYWHHIACVLPKDKKRVKDILIYVDGELQETFCQDQEAVINTMPNNVLIIGDNVRSIDKNKNSMDEYKRFTGQIDDFGYWVMPLSGAMVKSLCQAVCSELHYSVQDMNKLIRLYKEKAGEVQIEDILWKYETNINGIPGKMTRNKSGFVLNLSKNDGVVGRKK